MEYDIKNKHPAANIAGLSAGVFMATVRKAKRSLGENKIQLFSLILADILKALAPKKESTINLENLPK